MNELAPFDLFRWIAKIFLGMQYKELFLKADRSSKESGCILDENVLKQCSILHFWMQISNCLNNSSFCPGSIWLFRAQVPSELSGQFDLMDGVNEGVIVMRIGSVVIAADFLENGVHREITEDRHKALSKISLHPLQVRELAASLIYEASLLGQETSINFVESNEQFMFTVNWWSTVEDGAVMRPFVKSQFASYLAAYTGRSYESVYHPPDEVRTWLRDTEGNFVYLPLYESDPDGDRIF